MSAILEYAFGESDRIDRGGGGLESHPRLTDTVLYRSADSNTIMQDARETILALAPKEFSISLSSCFNYTQNYKEYTYRAKPHHSGKGIRGRAPSHPMVKMWLARIANVLQLKSVTQKLFAEYHSKRNPVE